MVQIKQTLPDYVVWYFPSDENRFQWIGHNFIGNLSLLWQKITIFATRGTKYPILKQ